MCFHYLSGYERQYMPLIRIVIPTYNRAHLVGDALESVLAQTFGDFEVIVVDDGSTDDTAAVVQCLLVKDTRIRLCQLAHGGVAKARNAGIREDGQHKYVAFLDSDDLWLPQHLERAVSVLEREPQVSVFFSRTNMPDVTGQRTQDHLQEHQARMRKPVQISRQILDQDVYLLDAMACRRAFLLNEFCPKPSTAVVRCNAVKRTLWFHPELEVLEDVEFFLFMASNSCSFVFDDTVHVQMRRFGDNLTGGRDLRSPHVLRRLGSVLEYSKMKLAHCLSPEEFDSVLRQVADAAYLVGQCNSEQLDLIAARPAYRDSLQHRFSYNALKGFLISFLPVSVYVSLRNCRCSGLASIPR
jgi:glycosyltransferase involved in cell wall biosynthesis